ncbi:type II secretion system protein [Bacillus massiliigorillae]|uniref:type II secretion system protein n=1 Tax=Bacillus massiliigorillae TaxID=1243664 RepID=UPI0005A96671|nr:type II secretion system protein [Bacillus massiliigorillae]
MSKLIRFLRCRRGFTLIELLAVIVILGILALIAIVSIGGLIDNSKKDAHVANAYQMITSGRMAIASEPELATGTKIITLKYLEYYGYLEEVEDPDGDGYLREDTDIPGVLTEEPSYISYLIIENGVVKYIRLINKNRGIHTPDPSLSYGHMGAIRIDALNRDAVYTFKVPIN